MNEDNLILQMMDQYGDMMFNGDPIKVESPAVKEDTSTPYIDVKAVRIHNDD